MPSRLASDGVLGSGSRFRFGVESFSVAIRPSREGLRSLRPESAGLSGLRAESRIEKPEGDPTPIELAEDMAAGLAGRLILIWAGSWRSREDDALGSTTGGVVTNDLVEMVQEG